MPISATGAAPFYNQNDLAEDKILENVNARLHALENALNAIGFDAKASKKRRFPSKRQMAVLLGITRGFCVETIDPWKENRVRFYHPILHDPQAKLFSLPFAAPVSPMGGFDDCGLNWVPPAGSTLMLFFEGGSRDAPFYIGTTWQRHRGPNGQQMSELFPGIREYQAVYAGHRKGYLHGPDDESQVFPPWNTESYNAGDIDQLKQFTSDPNEQKRITYPNIYGFKTPEKHMLKMVDGNAKCNRRWKRLEILSGCGNWMIFKDDHLHYGGQWSHPDCNPKPGGGQVEICSEHQSSSPFFSDIHGQPLEKPICVGKVQHPSIIKGHSSTPCAPKTKYCDTNQGTNKFFKHKNECRPYRGVGTPQNNRCDLPQSGIQFLSLSGITMVFDDSVEEPKGKPEWERSMQSFDFGCSDKYFGRFYVKSGTGHEFMISDIEQETALRGKDNFIRLKTANGNKFELNDHTVGAPDKECPPNYAGDQRGVHIESTSKHIIKMIDHMNLQCSPKRKEGGVPVAKATQAYIQIRSGYGLEMRFNDDNSQEETQNQWIQITHPQCVDPNTDTACNGCGDASCRGPHFLRFQGRPKGTAGIVFLRAGGHAIRQTYDMDIVLVGDKEKNPADKFTYVSKQYISTVEKTAFRYSGEMHVLMAEQQILLLAGRDCPPAPGKNCKSPCIYNVIISRCPVFCPLTNIVHWTEKSMSERVFASGYHKCKACAEDTTDCGPVADALAMADNPPCNRDNAAVPTGAGGGQPGAQNVGVPVQAQPGGGFINPNVGAVVAPNT